MTAVYMTHPEHGATHAYSNVEVEAHKKNGWVVSEYPKPKYPDIKLSKMPIDSLNKQYEEKFGKKPHHRASEKTIQDALKE